MKDLAPDHVFLDAQMPGGDGFVVLERIDLSLARAIVFVTAHEEDAIPAFEVNALDDLLKPFKDLEKSPGPRKVVRIPRSVIVRFQGLTSMVSHSTGNAPVLLGNGTKLPPARKKRRLLDALAL